MVEIPAAALSPGQMLKAVDFVSIGTNDLAQYTLAADRMSGPLAALNDPWQPALLRLIGMVGAAGETEAKPVGICGEAAADPASRRCWSDSVPPACRCRHDPCPTWAPSSSR